MFREDYIKEEKIVEKTEKQKEEELYKDLEESKVTLNSLYENLKFANRYFSRFLYLSNKS